MRQCSVAGATLFLAHFLVVTIRALEFEYDYEVRRHIIVIYIPYRSTHNFVLIKSLLVLVFAALPLLTTKILFEACTLILN